MHCTKDITSDLIWLGGSDRRLAWLDTVRRLYRRAMKSDRNELMIAWAKANL